MQIPRLPGMDTLAQADRWLPTDKVFLIDQPAARSRVSWCGQEPAGLRALMTRPGGAESQRARSDTVGLKVSKTR